ncbi:ATP/GTP-binding protein [Streptomyces sp. NPDC051286]|uniref:ATP/GTP-binding protein n=1 Tax=Streptomyces sp. NPDC051286 TaxID=3365647 RepID=UPI00379EBA04
MLLSFRVANHRSIRDEQQFNLSPVYETDRPDATAWEAVPVAAVFGANAAGKSNVIDAFRFMRDMVCFSHREAEPDGGIERTPFALDAEEEAEPSWYIVDLLLSGVRYTYGFGVDDDCVVEEWLYSYPRGRRRTVFHRTGDDIEYGEAERPNRRELDLVMEITEPNSLYISVAARAKQGSVRPVYDFFRSVECRPGSRPVPPSVLSTRMLEDPRWSPSVVELLRASDLGIETAGVERFEVNDFGGRVVRRDPGAVQESLPGIEAEPPTRLGPSARRIRTRVWVEQRGRHGTRRLGLEDQSEGTRRLFAFAGPVLSALDRGGLLLLDEIDASLHPRLTAHLIRLFQSSDSNPRGAQLVLTTHDVSLLGRSGGEDILKRDQIWFVEKDKYGETSLFPLSDFKPRQEENRERRYLGGSYGAVPVLNDERFAAAVASRGRMDGEFAGE